ELAFEQAQQPDVYQPPPSPVVAPHPLPDPMPSPPRQSLPSPIPFGPTTTSGVVSTEPILDIPSSFGPSEPVLETITSPFRDDDTGGGSFHESPPHHHLRIATLEAELKATKILHRDAVVLLAKRIKKLESKLKTKKRKLVMSDLENEEEARASAATIIYKRLKKQKMSSGLDFTNTDIPASGLDFAASLDSAGGLVSAGGVDSAGGLNSAGISVAVGPTVPAEPSSPLRDPSKGKAVATPSPELKQNIDAEQVYLDSLLAQRVAKEHDRESMASVAQSTHRQAELDGVALNLTNKEWIGLVDQVRANPTLSAKLLGTDVSEDTFSVRMVELMNRRRKVIAEMKAKAKRKKPMTPAQQKEFMHTFICRAVDLAIAKDKHQHLKRSGETLESSGSKTLKSSHSTTQPAELQETTSVSAHAPIAAGASGSASEAYVPIIELLDSPPKDTSLPLDSKTGELNEPLRKSSRKKSIARKRSLPSPSKPKSDALLFDEDDLEAAFKMYLRQASNNDEPAKPISLALVSDITTWEIIPTEFGLGEMHVITRADGTVKRFSTLRELMYWAGRADLMVLYGLVLDKYKTKRATSIGLGFWMDLRTLITTREERDASIRWDDQDQWQIQS
nr:JmjC domain-containing protein [Tanacetum cinerariifolium]